MKQKGLFLVFIFWVIYAHSQSLKSDSLLTELNKSGNDTLKVNILNNLSAVNVDFGFHPEATNYARQALQLATELHFDKGVVDATIQLGSIAYFIDNLSDAFQNFIDALKLSEQIRYDYGTGMSNVFLGRICGQRRDKESANRYFNDAIQIFEAIHSKKGLCYAHNWKGGLFETNHLALEEFTMANRLAIETGNIEMQARTVVNIGVAYRELKMFNASDSCYQIGLKLFEEIGNKDRLEWLMSLIGENFFREGQFQKALFYTRKASQLCKELGRKKVDYDNTFLISEIHAKLKNFDSAFSYRVQYEAELDSSKNGESMRKIKELELKYLFDKQKEQEKAEQQRKEIRQRLIRNVFIGGFALVLLFALVFLKQRNSIKKEKHKSDDLLENILPAKVASELKATGKSIAKSYNQVTVMFTDIKGFTRISEHLTPEALVAEIDFCFKAFDKIIIEHRLEKIKTIGDAYMCAGGLPDINSTHPIDTVCAALAIQKFMSVHQQERLKSGQEVFEIRIGIHTGNVVAGIVGLKKFAYDIWGDTVNIASRMESSGEVGKVNISGATYELVKDKFTCVYRGKIAAKNKGEMDMYFVEQMIVDER